VEFAAMMDVVADAAVVDADVVDDDVVDAAVVDAAVGDDDEDDGGDVKDLVMLNEEPIVNHCR